MATEPGPPRWPSANGMRPKHPERSRPASPTWRSQRAESFDLRALPCLLQLLREHALEPDIIVMDEAVHLDAAEIPGLGRRRYDACGGRTAVVGVSTSTRHAGAVRGISGGRGPAAHRDLRRHRPRCGQGQTSGNAWQTTHPDLVETGGPDRAVWSGLGPGGPCLANLAEALGHAMTGHSGDYANSQLIGWYPDDSELIAGPRVPAPACHGSAAGTGA